jgi:hypothetical protein
MPEVLFGHALVAMCIFAFASGDRRLLRGSAALLANWSVLSVVYLVTGDQFCVPLNMAVDWATLIVGFAPLTAWPQALMALSIGVGMMFHADYLLKEALGHRLLPLQQDYWDRFYFLMWAQTALLGVWGVHGGGRTVLRAARRWARNRLRLLDLDWGLPLDSAALVRGGS